MLGTAGHRWRSFRACLDRRPPHTSAGRDPRECHQWGSLLVPHVRHIRCGTSDTHDKRGVAERCSAVIGGADRLQRHMPGHVGYHMFAWRPSGGMAVGWRPWLDGPTLQFLQVRRVQRTLSVAVRAMGGPGACVHGHMADSVAAADAIKGHLRSSGTTRWFREQRSVKPSAQPTLVRTQHLPPPAKTARSLRKRGPAGRFLLVTPCISVCHRGSMRSSGCVHMVYSVRAERAVRITARFADPRPFCPVSRAPDCRASRRPVLRRAARASNAASLAVLPGGQ